MFDVSDKRLWGNEAADDENPEILNSYFSSNNIFDRFFDDSENLVIARARKGMGKSALVNELSYRLSKENDQYFVLNIKGSDLAAQIPIKYVTPDEHIHDWMQRICMIINRKIGSSINFAFYDDEILLVESSEMSGYKQRNLLGSLISRFKLKTKNFELSSNAIEENIKILERKTNKEQLNIWVLVDDIDSTFVNNDQERRRLSTFFSACREISSSFKGVKIRSTCRTDVWSSIRKSDEALDKVEQYIVDLRWSTNDMGKLLAKRINAYEKRVNKFTALSGRQQRLDIKLVDGHLKRETWTKELDKVFPPRYQWGDSWRESYNLLHLLGDGRPRWVLQLCRMASIMAKKSGATRIKLGNIKDTLTKYCSLRIDDLCREHQHQCESIAEIIHYFSNKKSSYTTKELTDHIMGIFEENSNIAIDGVLVNTSLGVAHFLFRIGFIHAQHLADHNVKYISFEDNPELLRYESNLDDGLQWTIVPAFRTALNIAQNSTKSQLTSGST